MLVVHMYFNKYFQVLCLFLFRGFDFFWGHVTGEEVGGAPGAAGATVVSLCVMVTSLAASLLPANINRCFHAACSAGDALSGFHL